MSTFTETDKILINRGGVDYQTTLAELREYVNYVPPMPWEGHDGGIWHIQNVRNAPLKLNLGWGAPGGYDPDSPLKDVQVYAMNGTDLGKIKVIPEGLECVIVTPPDSSGLFGKPVGGMDAVEWDFGPLTDTSKVVCMRGLLEEIIGSPTGMENWDVSNVVDSFRPAGGLLAFNGMHSLLKSSPAFNEDLSNWCVTNITTEPPEFSYYSPFPSEKKPCWGHCPPQGDPCPPKPWPDFKSASAPEDNSWVSVTYGDGKYVAISGWPSGTNRVMYSDDAINWTSASASEDNDWTSVTYGNGTFVAVSVDGANRVMYSDDAINWTSVYVSGMWFSVTYGDGKFVAVAQGGTDRVMYSTDAINWTVASAPEANSWTSVTYGDGKFVAVAANGTKRVMYSTNGIDWTAASAAERNVWYSVTYGDGKFVAVSWDGTNRVMYSTDAINWTAASAAEDNKWVSVTYGDGKFIAVSWDGTNRVMYSTDAINWTSASASEANSWVSVTYGDNKFVAVSSTGTNRAMWSNSL